MSTRTGRVRRSVRSGAAGAVVLALVGGGLADCGPTRFEGLTGGSAGPRLVSPLSGSIIFTTDPTLTWEMPSSVEEVILESCDDLECAVVRSSVHVRGTRGSAHFEPVPFDVAPGEGPPKGIDEYDFPDAFYWRVRAEGRPPSATWLVYLAPSRKQDRSWGFFPDLNADGNIDLVIGFPADNAIAVLPSDELIRSASVDLEECVPRSPLRRLRDRPDLVNFGGAIAAVGDVDGDGFGDVLVASVATGFSRSRVFAFHGAAGAAYLRDGPGEELTVDAASPTFGLAMAGPGDIDGDGYADVVIGDAEAGAVFVFWGSRDGLRAHAPVRLTADSPLFGCSVTGAGDLDGDGLADFAASAECDQQGRVLVFYGTRDRQLTRRVELERPAGVTGFGDHLALGGDTDRDGRSELFVASTRMRRAYLFQFAAPGDRPALRSTFDGDGVASFGFSVASALDTGTVLGDMWVASKGDATTRGQLSLWPSAGPADVFSSVFPEFELPLASSGRVLDVAGGMDSPVLSVARSDGQAIGLRSGCLPDAGYGGVETFATSRGDIVFAH